MEYVSLKIQLNSKCGDFHPQQQQQQHHHAREKRRSQTYMPLVYIRKTQTHTHPHTSKCLKRARVGGVATKHNRQVMVGVQHEKAQAALLMRSPSLNQHTISRSNSVTHICTKLIYAVCVLMQANVDLRVVSLWCVENPAGISFTC